MKGRKPWRWTKRRILLRNLLDHQTLAEAEKFIKETMAANRRDYKWTDSVYAATTAAWIMDLHAVNERLTDDEKKVCSQG